jgi:hypothetical protein
MKLLLCIIVISSVFVANSVLSAPKSPYAVPTIGVAVQAQTVNITADESVSPSQFPRGKVVGTDCRPDFNKGAHYESQTVGKDELLYYFKKLGIPEGSWDTMASIAMAESIRGQISCHGDDYAPYYMQKAPNGQTFTYSIGLFQIRLIKEQTGTGQCRDESRLKDNIEQQIICAWEISNGGKSWSPWSVTHANRGKPYLNWLGKHWGAFSWDGKQWTGG